MSAGPVDREALLVALVLAPATYSRNRFFSMYTDPEVRRVRRRASVIRSVVRHVTGSRPGEEARTVEISPPGPEGAELRYHVPALGLRRTLTLQPLELSLVRFAMAKSEAGGGAGLGPADPDRARIEAALAQLAPV